MDHPSPCLILQNFHSRFVLALSILSSCPHRMCCCPPRVDYDTLLTTLCMSSPAHLDDRMSVPVGDQMEKEEVMTLVVPSSVIFDHVLQEENEVKLRQTVLSL